MEKKIDIVDIARELVAQLGNLQAKSAEEVVYYRGAMAGATELLERIKKASEGNGPAGQQQPTAEQPPVDRPLPKDSKGRGTRSRQAAQSV